MKTAPPVARHRSEGPLHDRPVRRVWEENGMGACVLQFFGAIGVIVLGAGLLVIVVTPLLSLQNGPGKGQPPAQR